MGGRILWICPRDDFPIIISAEYIFRRATDDDCQDSEKFAFIIEYKINETWSVFARVGKAFDLEFEGSEESVSQFGLNFGFEKGLMLFMEN